MSPAGPVLLDNTILSNLAQVGRPDLALRVWEGQACTTHDTLAEFAAGAVSGGWSIETWIDLPLVQLTEDERATAGRLPRGLGPGERSCLAVALDRSGIVVTDDRRARAVAAQLGVQVAGTISTLVLAVQSGQISHGEADQLLAEMIARGYRSPLSRLPGSLTEW